MFRKVLTAIWRQVYRRELNKFKKLPGGPAVDTTVTTYVVYLLISIALTVWVGTTLFRNGRLFLVDVFNGNERLADAVNRLLVVGFYLLNLGFVTLFLRVQQTVVGVRGSFDALSVKVGTVLLVLGAIHLSNVYVFSRIRRRGMADRQQVPSAESNPWAPPPEARASGR